MTYIGIDPGKSGAMAIIDDDGYARVIPFAKESYLKTLGLFSKKRSPYLSSEARCVLEHVGAMPGQGVTSMFNFGESFGWLQGVLDTFGIPYELVRPAKWKKEFSVTSDKNTSVNVARRLFPNVSLLRSVRCRKDDDGMAEALLMAEYARRHLREREA